MHLLSTQTRLIAATALFLLVTANTTFFTRVLGAYPLSEASAGFLLTIPLVLGAVLVLLLTLVSSRYTIRPALIALVLLSSIAGHFTDRFGAIVDTVMIGNALATSRAEALELLSPDLLVRFVLLGVVPALVIARAPIRRRSPGRELAAKAALAGSALLVATACIFSFSAGYTSFFREHKPLRYYTTPTYPLFSLGKYLVEMAPRPTDTRLRSVGLDAHVAPGDPDRELVILVVGETVRADRFSLNGYHRRTNPRLEKVTGLFSYTNVSACGTSTAVSVPCMFALEGREGFDRNDARREENVLDVLKRAGVNVLWRDNNSSSKGVADRVEYQDFKSPSVNPLCDVECRDEGMLAGLDEYIAAQGGDILIVLHQIGNHGPAYYRRYPRDFERFEPACHSAELASCTAEEIGNAYDNAVLYTDHFLSKVIELLKPYSGQFETAMLYVSDHGESLGENGLYLHGMPYFLAPPEQTRVPLLVWVGEPGDVSLVSVERRRAEVNSQDAIFDSLLELFEVETAAHGAEPSLFDVDPDRLDG